MTVTIDLYELFRFVAFSAIVTSSSEVLKKLVHTYDEDISCGLVFAIILGLITSISYGTGLLGGLFEIEYSTSLYPQAFRAIDLVMSGLIYALSSSAIVDLYQRVHEPTLREAQKHAEQAASVAKTVQTHAAAIVKPASE